MVEWTGCLGVGEGGKGELSSSSSITYTDRTDEEMKVRGCWVFSPQTKGGTFDLGKVLIEIIGPI